ncbi:SUMF1/EgtB/PvdO family nonheme iron enzyme [Sessilibacter sp. MAH4]
MAKRYALVIGSNNYQNFPTLKKAEADALAVEKLLSDHVLGEFDSIVSLTQNVTNKETSIAIKRFFTDPNIEKDDFLLLFFAGHGHRDIIADKLYFAFEDSDPDFLEATALDCYHLRNWMRYSASKKQLVLLDCCYGGHFLESRGDINPIQSDLIDQNTRGRFVITSSAKNQKAYEKIEGSFNTPNSPFTHAFIEGLQTGKVKNNEGVISVRGIYNYINNYVAGLSTLQEPKLFGPDGDSDLILKAITEKVLPEGLHKKLFSNDPDVRLGSVIRLRRLVKDDISYLNVARKTVIDMDAKERDRHVYLELTDLQRFLSSQINQSAELNINTPSNNPAVPTIITDSKTHQPGDVFQDTLKDGSLGPRMVVIPAGEFLMGSPDDEVGRYENEGPQHLVSLESFALSETVVTFYDYDLYCKASEKVLPHDSGWGRNNRPIINISWDDANEFVLWLSEQTGKSYRLPSESQWEYACRAGFKSAFNTGECIDFNHANFNGFEPYHDCQIKPFSPNKTRPVRNSVANAFGLFDMHGNVWEWCADMYKDHYHDMPSDGEPRKFLSKDTPKTVRGGSYVNGPRSIRSAVRNGRWKDARSNKIGFRLCREL